MSVKYMTVFCTFILRFHFPDIEMRSPELKPRRGLGRRGVPGGQQRGALGGTEDENQAWLAMLEKATNSVRYISRHIKKEHFIREVWGRVSCHTHTHRISLLVSLFSSVSLEKEQPIVS